MQKDLAQTMDVYAEPGLPEFPRVPWKWAVPILLVYILAIVAATWPWLQTTCTHTVDHWDPPLDAWKLAYTARQILAGHLLPPAGDMTTFYPHSLVFYYEGLHWPPAFFAAPLLAAGCGEVFTYHASFVVFWALSGMCFWAFLRALGLKGAAAFLGGLFFTLMPYRTSYTMEFNMQLSFGLPLFLFFAVRFFQRPGIGYAVGAAVAWWLQAMSELYQAMFLVFVMPLFALALLSGQPALLKSWRRFWLPLLVAGGVGGLLTLWGLWPYPTLLSHQMLARSAGEMRNHILEPFTYFLKFSRFQLLTATGARPEEMATYPTVALLIGGAAYALRGRLAAKVPAGWPRWTYWGVDVLRWTAAVCFAGFAAMVGGVHFGWLAESWLDWAPELLTTALICVMASLVRPRATIRHGVLAALGAAAMFGLTMGFGPTIQDGALGGRAMNGFFHFFYDCVPAVNGFRVISRYSLFVEMFLCAGTAAVLDGWLRKGGAGWKRRAWQAAAWGLVALFLVECVPDQAEPKREIRDVSGSAAIAAFDALPEEAVLAMVPMGKRDLDAEHMLTISKDKRLFVYAWDGNFPDYAQRVMLALGADDPREAVRLLQQLWPTAYVMEDKRPCNTVEAKFLAPKDYGAWFGELAETVAEDEDFRLLRLRPDTTEREEFLKLVRHDKVEAARTVAFTLRSEAGAKVWLDLNGVALGGWEAGPTARRIHVPVAQWDVTELRPNRFRFRAEDGGVFSLTDFTLTAEAAEDGGALVDFEAGSAQVPWVASPSMWSEVPEGAVPVGVRYPNGLEIVASELGGEMDEGGRRKLYHYVRIPKGTGDFYGYGLTVLWTDNGNGHLGQDRLGLMVDLNANEIGALEGLQRVEQRFLVPRFTEPGHRVRIGLQLYSGRTKSVVEGLDAKGRRVEVVEYPWDIEARYVP